MARRSQVAADHRYWTSWIGGKHAEPWRTRIWLEGQRSWWIPQRLPWWQQPKWRKRRWEKRWGKRRCSKKKLQPGFWLLKHHTLALEWLFFFQPWRFGWSIFCHFVFSESTIALHRKTALLNKLIALQLCISTALFKPIHMNVNFIKVVLIHIHWCFCLYFTLYIWLVHLQAKEFLQIRRSALSSNSSHHTPGLL